MVSFFLIWDFLTALGTFDTPCLYAHDVSCRCCFHQLSTLPLPGLDHVTKLGEEVERMSFPSSSDSVQRPALIRSGSGGKCPYTEEEEERGRWGSQWVDFLRSRRSSRLLGRGEEESVRERIRERFLFGNTVQGPSLCCWWEEGSFGPERWCAAELGWVLDRKERLFIILAS